MQSLYDRLREYGASDYYGFHMPGHKRRGIPGTELPCEIDITEIDGFDDLHHAGGILKESQELAASVYGAEESRFLVNGSTVGILSAILGSTDRGDRILMARNCHRSVYHAVYLNCLDPIYVYPVFDGGLQLNTDVPACAVRAALEEYPDIRVAVVTSPTYDGVISDIEGIADAVHERGGLLIVDEAHGAHLGFHPYFEKNSLAKGADIVIHSVHKTLPALTQTALLHMQGNRADREKVFRYLDMLQSSSPSYILMAGIDSCIHLLSGRAEELFDPYVRQLARLRTALGSLGHFKLLETECYDRSKLVIASDGRGIAGMELYQMLLERYHIQMEMAAGTYVLAMTSVMDSPEGFARLEKALGEIDAGLLERPARERPLEMGGGFPVLVREMSCKEALDAGAGAQYLLWEQALGKVSAEFAYLYPPGNPLIVPGERITEEAVRTLRQYQDAGFSVHGLAKPGQIGVVPDITDR